MSNDPHFAANPWFELTRQGQRQQWDCKAHQRLAGYASTVPSVRQFPIRMLVCEIYGFARGGHPWQLTTNPSILRILSGEFPSRWDDRPRPVILRHVGDAMAMISTTRPQKLASWACSDQNNPKPNLFKQRHVDDLVHGVFYVLVLVSISIFEVIEAMVLIPNILIKTKIKNHGFNFPKMFLVAEICGFN